MPTSYIYETFTRFHNGKSQFTLNRLIDEQIGRLKDAGEKAVLIAELHTGTTTFNGRLQS